MARVRGALVLGLTALALAGCSAAPNATPAPVKLDDLNLKPYVGKPCSLFDADQLSDLRMGQAVARPESSDLGVCVLSPADPNGPGAILHVETATPAPKSGRQTKIAGYPAFETAGTNDCTVRVVVADKQLIMTVVKGENACHLAESVATTAIATIKRLNP